jgi:hypothetical protein
MVGSGSSLITTPTLNGRLSIGECLVLLSDPGPFVVLPRRPKIDRDDHIMRDVKSKIIYERDLKWLGRDIAKQWSEGVLAALLENTQMRSMGKADDDWCRPTSR